jgi:apolipoprotein N-acyltransferase
MKERAEESRPMPLRFKGLLVVIALAAVAFHLAFVRPSFAPLILIYLGCLFELTRAHSARAAFYSGLALGMLVFAPKLTFFYTIFGIAALPLWLVLAFWHALFVYLGHRARILFPASAALLLVPVFWTGLEYFRSELYPLKFSWLAPGFAFGPNGLTPILGVYGITFVFMLVIAAIALLQFVPRAIASVAAIAMVFGLAFIKPPQTTSARPLKVAGLQLEFPVELEVPGKLDSLKREHPDADIYVLSEYTFEGPVPNCVRAWCKQNSKYLIAGGKDPAANRNFYNTAFVIDPSGEIIFKQVKAVPIQFFKDGLPALEQKLWNSPWGKIGLCVCYDLSYTRVIDKLLRQGAQIIVNPTMDVADWGAQQHELHSRIPSMRAAEYRIPIFRLASSGISQAIDATGRILASAPFPGDQSVLAAQLQPSAAPTIPLDRILAPICSALTIIAFPFCCGAGKRSAFQRVTKQ